VVTVGAKNILVLLSTAGGGDRQPVIGLAVALHERGHRVTILCDAATVDLVAGTGVPTVAHQVDQVGFISRWAGQLAEEADPPNPFLEWGALTFGEVRSEVAELAPDVIVSSLFCMGLADQLAEAGGVPWCFVNPSFYFGEYSRTTWEDDWHGSFVPRLARECFAPLVDRADMVLHATDRLFDFEPIQLPASHHYVGFLLWEPTQEAAPFLAEPGDPWALVTASTARPADEEIMLESAVAALTGRPVRTVLTLPKHDSDHLTVSGGLVAGFSPHIPILKKSVISINQAGHG
jgi:UDP:flavonoid glycosyltransferase YjiC (YdhE family)